MSTSKVLPIHVFHYNFHRIFIQPTCIHLLSNKLPELKKDRERKSEHVKTIDSNIKTSIPFSCALSLPLRYPVKWTNHFSHGIVRTRERERAWERKRNCIVWKPLWNWSLCFHADLKLTLDDNAPVNLHNVTRSEQNVDEEKKIAKNCFKWQ